MSLFKLKRGDFDSFSINTNPLRTYSSSSAGVTGSLNIFARRSSTEKDVPTSSTFVDSTHSDSGIASSIDHVQKVGKLFRNNSATRTSDPTLFNRTLQSFLTDVNNTSTSARKQQKLSIFRTVPSFNFTVDTCRKLLIKNTLNPYYRDMFPHANWAYTNYNCLNFFTASTVPTSSVLLYPNVEAPIEHAGFVGGTYSLSGAFSFDFCINPRYTTSSPNQEFKAGTLFHLSSSYAVSLISGSAKDENGHPSFFRLQLQLSHSADIVPSLAEPGTSFPNNLTFLSNDNVLKRNNWHHVIIRWGTNLTNHGTGSFNIDKIDQGTFVIPSGTIELNGIWPAALCVGNFYEGVPDIEAFFANDPATRDGLEVLDGTPGVETPSRFSFNHPLNAEVHDLMIKRYYMGDNDIVASASRGPTEIPADKFALFIPPFFVEDSPFRQFVGTHGGVPQTPFFELDSSTNDPFNVAMSFGVGGHYINLENFVRDFASDVFPRLHHLTGVAITTTTDDFRSANEYLYAQPFVVKRNLTILPCDDGTFVPNFDLLQDESPNSKFTNDLGSEDLSLINMSEMMNTSSLLFGTDFGTDAKSLEEANAFVDELIGFTPEQPGRSAGNAFRNFVRLIDASVASGTFDPGLQAGAPLTIYNRTRDASSNQVTMFDLSNLFYGDKIDSESFTMSDSGLSGSGGTIRITLKDDGRGNLYRADAETSHPKWNSVGSIYPYEGVIVIKSPHLNFFGQEQYDMSFRGERNVHVMKIDCIAPAGQLNSSSNPNFTSVLPSGHANDPDTEFVYVNQILLHDDNLNVVAKAQLVQPMMKRLGDKYLFRIKLDW